MHVFKDSICHTDVTNNVCPFFSQLCLNEYQDLLNISHLIV